MKGQPLTQNSTLSSKRVKKEGPVVTPAPELTFQDGPGKEGRSLSRSFRNFEEVCVWGGDLGCFQATSPSLLWLLGSLPKQLIIMESSHQRRLYFVPQRPNGASGKRLFAVSNKHFLGVINLYAKVTVGTGVVAQTVLAWRGQGSGAGAGSCQAQPSHQPSRNVLSLFLLLYGSLPSPTVGALGLPSPDIRCTAS